MSSNNVLILDAFWVDRKPFPSVESPDTKVGQVLYSGYPGTARYLGWMDLVQLKDLIRKRNISHIILRNLDLLGKMAQANGYVKICTSYIKRPYLIHQMPNKRIFKHCEPYYNMVGVGGWDFSLDDPDIPARAKWYMKYLLLQTNVTSITYSTNKVRVTVFKDEKSLPRVVTEQLE